MTSPIDFEPQLNTTSTFRFDPDSLESGRLTFTAYVSAKHHAHTASILDGSVKVQVWTDLPALDASSLDLVGSSRPLNDKLDQPAASADDKEWHPYDLGPTGVADAGWHLFRTTLTVPKRSIEGEGPRTFAFTYRLAFPDGRMEWLSYPHQDGRIQIVNPNHATVVDDVLLFSRQASHLALHAVDDDEIQASAVKLRLVEGKGDTETPLALLTQPYRASSGIVVERTKSSWCTSRAFTELAHVSPDFAASLLVFHLAAADAVVAVMPVVTLSQPSWILSRSRHADADGQHSICCRTSSGDPGMADVALAIGPRRKTDQVLAACRSAARALLTPASAMSKEVPMLLRGELGHPSTVHPRPIDDATTLSDGGSAASSPGLPASNSMSTLTDISFDTLPPTYESAMGLESGASRLHEPAASRPLDPKGGLGFCTWEAMDSPDRRPYLSRVIAAIESLETRFGTGCITSVLIDDGWQDVVCRSDDSAQRGSLNSWAMPEELFDVEIVDDTVDGQDASSPVLGRYVSHLQHRFPSIRHVGCWMTMAGYWDGIHPGGEIASQLRDDLVEVEVVDPIRGARRNWLIPGSESSAKAFWTDAFSSLRDAGVTFAKVDAQAEWDWIRSFPTASSKGESGVSASVAFDCMQTAALQYLGPGSLIHSMSGGAAMTNGARTLVPSGPDPGPVSLRMTDDFYPNVPDAHRHHLVHNALNAMLVAGQDDLRADADMFSSRCRSVRGEDWASYHASFRAFTDAKLWISDAPGPDRVDDAGEDGGRSLCVSRLLARTREGDVRTLQAQRSASNVFASPFADPVAVGQGPALKMCSRDPGSDVAVLGLWNARGEQADSLDVVSPALLRAVQPNQVSDLAVYRTTTGSTTLVSRERLQDPSSQTDPLLLVSLPQAGWESLVVAPLQTNGDVAMGCFGLIDKYHGAAAIAHPGLLYESGAATPSVEPSPSACDEAIRVETFAARQPLSRVLQLAQSRLDGIRLMLLLGVNTLFQTLLFGLGKVHFSRPARSAARTSDAGIGPVLPASHDEVGSDATEPRLLARALRRVQAVAGRTVVPRSRHYLAPVREAHFALLTLGRDLGAATLHRPASTLKQLLNPFAWSDLALRIPVAGSQLSDADLRDIEEGDAAADEAQRLAYRIELVFAGLVGFVVRASAERLQGLQVLVDQHGVGEEGIVQVKPIATGLRPETASGEGEWQAALVTVDLEALAVSRQSWHEALPAPARCDPGLGGWQVEVSL